MNEEEWTEKYGENEPNKPDFYCMFCYKPMFDDDLSGVFGKDAFCKDCAKVLKKAIGEIDG